MSCEDGLLSNCFQAAADYDHWPDLLQTIGQAFEIGNLGSLNGWWGTIQALFGIAGICVGMYFKYRHSEKQLHNTLASYLKRCDQRLSEGERYVLDAINRPSPGQQPVVPLFTVAPLRRILMRRDWDRPRLAISAYASCDKQLATAIDDLDAQIVLAQERLLFFRKQLSTAHIIRGALSAATPADRQNSIYRQIFALTSFDSALKVDGQENNLVAKELEAHQLRKLGQYDDALVAYSELERICGRTENIRQRNLLVARAKRYQAEIKQSQAIQVQGDGSLSLSKSHRAHQLLRQALELREQHDPYVGWELLEQADLHYLASLVAKTCKFTEIAPKQLMLAIGAYEGVRSEPLPVFWKRRNRIDFGDWQTPGTTALRRRKRRRSTKGLGFCPAL